MAERVHINVHKGEVMLRFLAIVFFFVALQGAGMFAALMYYVDSILFLNSFDYGSDPMPTGVLVAVGGMVLVSVALPTVLYTLCFRKNRDQTTGVVVVAQTLLYTLVSVRAFFIMDEPIALWWYSVPPVFGFVSALLFTWGTFLFVSEKN
tara:strand:- start:433268 stop:433717 length:450 start_codon:yes stop_codon:yes gene_type:complete